MDVRSRRVASWSGALVALVALAIALFSRAAAAQGNYRLAPVGGRTTLVGGTGLAYGRDSASAFLNPATIVRVDPGRLAFAVNFYAFSVATSNRWYQPGPVDPRFGDIPKSNAAVTNIDFDTLPGSLCLFLKAGDIGILSRQENKELKEKQARLGICLASVQSSIYSFNAEDYTQSGTFGRTRQAGSIRQTFRRFAIGPSYAMYVDDQLAIGVSLHFSRASLRSNIGNTTITELSGQPPISSVLYTTSRGDSHELTATLGATYRIRHQTLALAVDAPSLHLFGSGGTNLYTHSDGIGAPATLSASADGSFTTNSPLRVALGTGYEVPAGSVELNVSFQAPLSHAYEASFTGSSFQSNGATSSDTPFALELGARSKGAMNIGIGGELFLSPKISLLGGLNTDFSAVPKGALRTDPFHYFPSITNRVAGSFGYGSHGDGGDLLIGGEFSYGWGGRLVVNPYQLPPRLETADERQYVFLLVLAGSTSYKAIRRAVEDVTKALDPTKTVLPGNEPAREPMGGKKPTRETEPMKTDQQTEVPKAVPAKPEPAKPELAKPEPAKPAPAKAMPRMRAPNKPNAKPPATPPAKP